MALDWKLVVDTHDALAVAQFWAAALEYELEDPSNLVRQLRDTGQLPTAAIREHGDKLYFHGLAGIRHPDDPYDNHTGIGHGRRILFQDVPEAKSIKNRLHIDIHADDRDATVARLETLGATRVTEFDKGPAGHWWVMRDPEGNEFCVA